ncbi:MAG: hypothetical protein JWM34_4419 [Ilumatobacteraceae bacterium]|nr:hypothetical protein [Ilumatobacteraceae bacterium]
MSESVDDRIRALMGEIDRVAPPPPDFATLRTTPHRNPTAAPAPAAYGDEPRSRRHVIGPAIAAALIVLAVGVVVIARASSHHVSTISPTPGTSLDEPTASTSIGTAPVTTVTTAPSSTSSTTTTTAQTSTASTTPAATPSSALIVHPFGSRSEVIDVGVTDANVTTHRAATNPGDVVLDYELQIGFDPRNLSSTIETPAATSDTQLAIETSCATSGCLSVQPVNDRIQTTVQLTVRRTTVDLTRGEHDAPFAIHFTDGTVERFTIGLYAEPAPSEAIATQATTLTGPPRAIQTVFDIGHFDYHMISAFGSIWLLGQSSYSVTRLDARTGAVLASIPIGIPSNRLTANADAVYVAGDPVLRIDPATNTVTPLTAPGLTVNSRAIIADGQTLWAASLTGGIYRIDPDGTVTILHPSTPAAWVDLAVSHGKVWALGRDTSGARLVSFDESTSVPVDSLSIPLGPNLGIPARLVADERDVVVGIDPRTGGANGFQSNGELVIVDPDGATITATVPLPTRPEGIVLTDLHIWTSGAVLDRTTLAVTPITLGFTIARGPDGSIWATTINSGSFDATSIAIRYAPGDDSG